MPDLPHAIARFAAGVAARPEDIPADVAALCPNLMLNAAAAALAAAAHPDAVALAGIARAMGGNGRSTVIGMGQRTSPVYAALVNGTLIRLLDFDDHAARRDDAHPTAAVLPAVLALGEMHGSPGASALAAFAAGAEIVARLCHVYGDDSASRALAAAASPVGAAVAASILLGLDAAAIAHAVALAAGAPDGDPPPAGVPPPEVLPDPDEICRNAVPTAGPTAPALVSGRAAMNGVMAALQAQAGITAAGADDPDDGGGDDWPGGILYRLGETWQLADPGVAIRLYPCHPATHTTIDAALGLAQLHRFTPDDIAAVHIGLTRYTLAQLPWILPADGWQARSCPAFIAAATLCHGPPLINFFSDAAVRDPGVRALMERISVEASLRPSPWATPHPAEVAVTLRDGRTLRHRVDHPRGSPAVPPDDEELDAKFLYCTRYILPADHIDEAVTGFRSIAANPNITGIVSVLGG